MKSRFFWILVGVILLFPLAEHLSQSFFSRCKAQQSFPCLAGPP